MRKVRYTTYLSARHLEILERLAKEKDIPMVALLGNALDNYLQELKRLDSPEFPPIKEEFLWPLPRQAREQSVHA